MAHTELTVVIAVWKDTAALAECLAALSGPADENTEVIVVSTMDPPTDLVERYTGVQWLSAAANDLLIPHLWSQGMAVARGRIVAITTAHFVPAADWIAKIQDAHVRLQSPAIGGAIDPPCGGSAVDWATYFLRYSQYFKYDREQPVADIAGDNASYKRDSLEAHREAMRDGFWEPDFHRLILAEGQTLFYTPQIRVTQRASFGFVRFCQQRIHHGRQFGQARIRNCGLARRALHVASSPLIPLVLLLKIGSRVSRARRHLGAFAYALPVLICFVVAWSVGEACGYILGKRAGSAVPRGLKGRSIST